MANWRRERSGSAIHVVVEAAPFTLCGNERETLGPTIWDERLAARDLCPTCSRAMLAATREAERLTERVSSEAELLIAKDALRSLLRVVPDGHIRDLVIYARACIVRGDKKGAHESVKRWRTQMQGLSILPDEA